MQTLSCSPLESLDGKIEHQKQNHGEFRNLSKLLDGVSCDGVRILGADGEESVLREGFDFLVRHHAEHANGT